MKISGQFSKYAILGVVLAGMGLAFGGVFDRDKKGVVVDVQVPELSVEALRGKEAFNANCAQCHGKNGSGTGKGPPLIHQIYNPGHHGDQSFLRAAKRGVRGHHWPYGNMPKQPQVTNRELAVIVKYVRELQVANGIGYKPR
jgi:mono/diheme cytochrome c family protein